MNTKKLSSVELCNYFHKQMPQFKFISGKWFKGDFEIKNIDGWLLKRGFFPNPQRMIDFKACFRMMYGDPTGNWPDMEIVQDAHKIISEGGGQLLPPVPDFIDVPKLKIINYLLRHDEEYFIIINGVGGSGKSTFLNIIQQIFDGDTAAITLKELSEGFRLATAIDKRLIFSTEIDADRITDANIKKIVSGEPLNVNPKNEKPFQARFQAGFVFNCNIPPSINLADTGMLRRIIYYQMNEKIKNPDPKMNHKKWTYTELLSIVVAALKMNMNDFPECFESDTRKGLIERDTVYRYREEEDYQAYRIRCQDDNFKPYNRENWEAVRELLKDWGYIEIKSKSKSKSTETETSLWRSF